MEPGGRTAARAGWLAPCLFAAAVGFAPSGSRADDWPQWRGPSRDGVWRETGVIESFPGPRLQPAWRVPVGPGYSGPSVADGRVFLTDRQTNPEQVERVLAFDAATGAAIWTHTYPCVYRNIGYEAGPRASVTVDGEHVFSLGAMGHLHCLAAADGKPVWQRDLAGDYAIAMPIWGIAGAPLVDGSRLILHIGGAEGACVVALDKTTGREIWRALDDRGQYTAPILVEQGGRRVVVVWTGDSVAGLAAESGAVVWRVPFTPRNMPIGVATPVVSGDRLFLTSFYDGSMMLRLGTAAPTVETLWHRVGASERQTDALQSIIGTPLFLGGHVYGVDSYGELRCLDAATGDRLWEDLTATPKARWSTIHIVRHGDGDTVWMFNERGELIIARLTPEGFRPLSRTTILEPTTDQLPQRGGVCWSHPAFARRCVFARNDRELVCVSLAAP
ncbi:MAG: PQQ-binding-like beta-propeller repeat protein [Planctomycetaceae bacterium]